MFSPFLIARIMQMFLISSEQEIVERGFRNYMQRKKSKRLEADKSYGLILKLQLQSTDLIE